MAKKAKKLDTKVKKKKWCTILAPKIFLEEEIGETLFDSPSELLGKRVTANLMNLSGDPKRQSFNLTFEITDAKESKALTQCVGFEMTPAGVKRLVRRNRERIDESFLVMTSDGKLVRVKPFVLTRFNTTQSVKKSLRKALRQQLERLISSMAFEVAIKELVSGKVQQKMRETLKKVYPINIVEVREIRLLSKSEAAKVKNLVPRIIVEPQESAAETVQSKPDEPEPQEQGEPVEPIEVVEEKTVKSPKPARKSTSSKSKKVKDNIQEPEETEETEEETTEDHDTDATAQD